MKDLLRRIDSEEKAILNKADEFYKCLTYLRYEGRVSRGKNVKAAMKAVKEFQGMVHNHQKLQEGVIFPFLVRHIPRHGSVIEFLRADHQELKKNRIKLEVSLRKFSTQTHENFPGGEWQVVGVYFICLLRHHIKIESKYVHGALRRGLGKNEQSEVKKRIHRWLARHQSGATEREGVGLRRSLKR